MAAKITKADVDRGLSLANMSAPGSNDPARASAARKTLSRWAQGTPDMFDPEHPLT